jgi:iron complex transport system substrate-binding protein
MGLGDRLIGTSLLDSEVHPDLREAYDQVPVLSESSYPSQESLIGLGPDLLIGGFGPTFSEANGLPPDQFEAAGIEMFTVQCRGDILSFDTTMDTIAKLGVLFDAPEAAEELATTISAQVDAVAEQVAGREPVDVMIFDSGETAATVVASQGMENAIVTLAGGRNVFEDLDTQYTEVGWEEVVDRDPEVIVVVDYSPELADSAGPKIDTIRGNPALASVQAVRDDRFVVVPLSGRRRGCSRPRGSWSGPIALGAAHWSMLVVLWGGRPADDVAGWMSYLALLAAAVGAGSSREARTSVASHGCARGARLAASAAATAEAPTATGRR